MLRIALIGYLGSDAERRSTQKGSPLVDFRVAVNQIRSRSNSQRQETAEWFRVRVMGRQIDYAQRLAKGTRVFVAGRLDISHFQSAEGEPRTAFRRFRRAPVADVEGRTFPMRYYGAADFDRALGAGFRRVELRSLGLCFPPLSFGTRLGRSPWLLRLMMAAEDRTAGLPGLRHLGDHIILAYERI